MAAEIAKKDGTLGYCMSFVFSEFFIQENILKEFNQSLAKVKKTLTKNSTLEFTCTEDTEINSCLEVLEKMPTILLKLVAPLKRESIRNKHDSLIEVFKSINSHLNYLTEPKSWQNLKRRVKMARTGSQNAGSDSTNKEAPNSTPLSQEASDNNSFRFKNIKKLEREMNVVAESLSIPASRKGASKDAEMVKSTFSNLLFDTTPAFTEKDVTTKKDVEGIMSRYLERELQKDEEEHKFFVLVFSSHGNRDKGNNLSYICLPGGERLILDDIYDIMENSKILKGKRILIFIQACQGSERNKGKNLADTTPYQNAEVIEDEADAETEREIEIIIPSYSNFIIHYSTIPGFVSTRHPKDGSIFIQVLCKQLEEKVSTIKLHQILLDVNLAISELKFEHRNLPSHSKNGETNTYMYKQMPRLVTTSLGDFYLLSDKKEINMSKIESEYMYQEERSASTRHMNTTNNWYVFVVYLIILAALETGCTYIHPFAKFLFYAIHVLLSFMQ